MVVLETEATLTFFPRMPGLLATSRAMRKGEGSCEKLAEESQKCKHSPETVKQTKTKQPNKKQKTTSKLSPGSQHFEFLLELSYQPAVFKATRQLSCAPGSDPHPESGPKSAWGQRPRPGTLPTAEQAPVATGDSLPRVGIGVDPQRYPPLPVTHSPPGPRGGAAHLQLPAHVPAAPVVPAAARPKPRRRSGPRSRRAGVARHSGRRGARGPRRGALVRPGTRATRVPALIPGSREAAQWEGEAAATWEAPGARLLPGARLPAAGAQLAGVSRELGLRPQKPPNLLP